MTNYKYEYNDADDFIDLAMCGGGWYARHTANHHNHRGGQHHSETQAEEKSCRK